MNQARLKTCAASVVECLTECLTEWVSEVRSRIEIDLAAELFNLETWNFQGRQYYMCFTI